MHIDEFTTHLEAALDEVGPHYYGLSSARGDLQQHYKLNEATDAY